MKVYTPKSATLIARLLDSFSNRTQRSKGDSKDQRVGFAAVEEIFDCKIVDPDPDPNFIPDCVVNCSSVDPESDVISTVDIAFAVVRSNFDPDRMVGCLTGDPSSVEI